MSARRHFGQMHDSKDPCTRSELRKWTRFPAHWRLSRRSCGEEREPRRGAQLGPENSAKRGEKALRARGHRRRRLTGSATNINDFDADAIYGRAALLRRKNPARGRDQGVEVTAAEGPPQNA